MDKTVVITGATSGYGLAMAEAFDNEGARLVLVARGEEKLDEVSASLKGDVTTVAIDVCETEAAERILETAGSVDVWINNVGAGIGIGPVEELTDDEISRCLDLNLGSMIRACRTVLPAMKEQGSGLIINVSSACSKFAWPTWSVYSAAKAGMEMFGRCMYAECQPHGIQVTTITPGGANTGFQSVAEIDDFPWEESEGLRSEHIAHAAVSVAKMPKGGVVPEIVVYGQAQEIVPF